MKSILKSILPTSVQSFVKGCFFLFTLPIDSIRDSFRYIQGTSSLLPTYSKLKLQSLMLKDAHRIEKGLALPSPRKGFGRDVIIRLCNYLDVYLRRYGRDEEATFAIDALIEYNYRNEGVENSSFITSFLREHGLDSTQATPLSNEKGGVKEVTKKDIQEALLSNQAKDFFLSRYSVRQFGERQADINSILGALACARKTPSVCNRQTCKIYVIESSQLKNEVLSLQNGNRGFGGSASHIAVITSDIRCFEGSGERHQPYVDGGLTAMSFCLALHKFELATCFLNWSTRPSVDTKLNKLLGIPSHQVVITLMAIGTYPEVFTVASSPRRKLKEFYEIL